MKPASKAKVKSTHDNKSLYYELTVKWLKSSLKNKNILKHLNFKQLASEMA